MQKILSIVICTFFVAILSGCTNKEFEQLKNENAILKNEIKKYTLAEEKKDNDSLPQPDYLRTTISRLWGSLSKQTSIIWDAFYYNPYLWYEEALIINNWESVKDYIWYHFNRWWYLLMVSCWDWYYMTKCEPLWTSDITNVQRYESEKLDQCVIWNEDPDELRISMIVECHKE